MAGTAAGPAPTSTRRPVVPWEIAALAAVLVVAVLVRARPLLELDRFGLMGYDQAAYFAGGRALTLGYLPYRDFVHIQPPGVLYFLAPFSWFGTWGFTLAKVAVVGLGAVSAGLIWRIARPWCGSWGALLGAAVYALYRPSISAHRYLLIEPLVTVSVLAAIAVFPADASSSRARARAVATGGLFALALTCKLFAVVPIAAFVVALLVHRRSREYVKELVAGFGVTGIVLLGPWLVIGGSSFLEYTISTQSGRPRAVGMIERLLESYWFAGRSPTDGQHPAVAIVVIVLIGLVVWGCWTRSFVGWIAASWLTFGTILILAAPQFYDHYAELIAPPVALLVGGLIAWPVHAATAKPRRIVERSVQIAFLAVLVVGAISTVLEPLPKPFLHIPGEYAANLDAADAFIRDGRCVISDSPEIALIVPDTVAYAVTGDAPVVDPFAVGVNAGKEAPIPPASLAQFQRSLSRCGWFASPRYWPARSYPGWSPAMETWFLAHYEPVTGPTGMELWRRKP